MTKAKPGAWAECPLTLKDGSTCGRRMRATSQRCSKCYLLEYDRQRHYRDKAAKREARTRAIMDGEFAKDVDVAQVAELALSDATSNGHSIVMELDDTEDEAYVGRCASCERWLSVDILAEDENGERTPVFGRVTEGACPGEPDAAPVVLDISRLDIPGRPDNQPDQKRSHIDYTRIAASQALSE